jgi:hypothetical protein
MRLFIEKQVMPKEMIYRQTKPLLGRDTGSENFGHRGQRAIVALFHLVRYTIAVCATGIAIVILPIIAIVVLAGLITLFLLLTWIAFLFGAPLDGGALQAIFWFVVAPISLLLSTVVSVILVLFLAVVYTVIGVLPVSLLVEIVFWRHADHQLSFGVILARLASSAVAGLVLGVVVGGIVLLLVQPAALLEVGIICTGAVLISVCSTFFFGLILTLMLITKAGLLVLLRRFSRKEVAA